MVESPAQRGQVVQFGTERIISKAIPSRGHQILLLIKATLLISAIHNNDELSEKMLTS